MLMSAARRFKMAFSALTSHAFHPPVLGRTTAVLIGAEMG